MGGGMDVGFSQVLRRGAFEDHLAKETDISNQAVVASPLSDGLIYFMLLTSDPVVVYLHKLIALI